MTLNRYAKRRDSNEPEIVEALKLAGCTVERRDDYDLHVTRGSRQYRLEVKMPNGKLTKRQRQRQDRGEDIAIVRSVVEALRAVGLA